MVCWNNPESCLIYLVNRGINRFRQIGLLCWKNISLFLSVCSERLEFSCPGIPSPPWHLGVILAHSFICPQYLLTFPCVFQSEWVCPVNWGEVGEVCAGGEDGRLWEMHILSFAPSKTNCMNILSLLKMFWAKNFM